MDIRNQASSPLDQSLLFLDVANGNGGLTHLRYAVSLRLSLQPNLTGKPGQTGKSRAGKMLPGGARGGGGVSPGVEFSFVT